MFKKILKDAIYNRDDNMKKIIILLSIITVIFVSNKTTDDLIIPDEAIRVRVIANSNSINDQTVKQTVKNSIEKEITELLVEAKSIDDARNILKLNLNDINKTVERILEKNNYLIDYEVNYGYNHFPQKKYKGVIYEEGYYESIVITLGSGEGDNWWCVLFPPLCLMESNSNDIEEVEYKSFIKELIDKYF